MTALVLGYGKSGRAAAAALAKTGTRVIVWDDGEPLRRQAVADGFATAEDADFDTLVLSPGVPRSRPAPHRLVTKALAEGRPIINDLDLLGRAAPDARYCGITGTNGKSTTTALLGHILAAAGLTIAVGGNLGTPALALPTLGADGVYVLELSSYQLETVSEIGWDVGILLNITPDHLDRYVGMDDYVAAKRRLFAMQPAGATAIVGVDDDWGREIADAIPGVVRISGETAADVGVVRSRLVDRGEAVLDFADAPALPGAHNRQNAAAAYAAARALGLERPVIAAAIRSFPGLAHRQQVVARVGGVRLINDSKATNPDAAAKALAAYDTIHWIAGGKPKDGGLDALEPWLDRVVHAYLIGAGTEKFAAFLDGRRPYSRCGDLATATRAALSAALVSGRKDTVVLLSPACASFDQFANFEARGEAFAALARELASAEAA